MIAPFYRESLVSRIATALRQEIAAGAFGEWLPEERSLSARLQVSRTTLRLALQQLKEARAIEAIHGQGNRVLLPPPAPVPAKQNRNVALLMHDPIEQMRPAQTLWIDELRALLSERGSLLHVFHGRSFLTSRPENALKKLVARQPHGCWLLMNCNAAAQRWFQASRIPCLVAGTPVSGIALPHVDIDHAALCRHAAGTMIGLGHRRLAFLLRRARRGGDLESERGFRAAIAASPATGVNGTVLDHADTVDDVDAVVLRAMQLKQRPTALLVANPHYYLTVLSRLAQLHLRIPQDVSVVSRDHDHFLSFLRPAPTRYEVPPRTLAHQRLHLILDLLDGAPLTQPDRLIVPDFVRGETLVRRE